MLSFLEYQCVEYCGLTNLFVDILQICHVHFNVLLHLCDIPWANVEMNILCLQADLDGERFLTDLTSQVKKSVAFDAIMRVRTSTGGWHVYAKYRQLLGVSESTKLYITWNNEIVGSIVM